MPTKPTRKKQKGTATRIEPSMLDQLEAMVRHPEFRRSLALWRSIFEKNYTGLTEEEDRERDAPRTRIRIAAIQEADRQWLSRSIRYIRKHGEAKWTFRAVNLPSGDRTDSGAPRVPYYLPKGDMARCVLEWASQQQRRSGVQTTQRPRRPEIDPWKVHDLKHEGGLNLLQITRQLLEVSGSPTEDNPKAKLAYKQIANAYRRARAHMKRIDQ